MYTIKGFLANEALYSNIPTEVYQFGELSTKSMTYAKEKGFYSNVAVPDVRFISFMSKDAAQVQIPVPAVAANHILEVGQYLYTRYTNSTIGTDTNTLISEIAAQFNAGTFTLTLIEIPAIAIDFANNSKRLPEYMHWILEDSATSEVYDIYVWFGDEYFATQYTDYEIIVIPPIPNVNNFYGTVASLDMILAGVTTKSIIDQVEIKAANQPYTHIGSLTTRWCEHFDFGNALRNVYWTFIIYGAAGQSPDAQNQAIREYLANPANTTIALTVWQAIFPSVYETSEYFVVPYWEHVSTNVPTPIYRAVSKPAKALSLVQANIPVVPTQMFLETNVSTVSYVYQGIMAAVLGSPNNTSNLDFDIANKFPDYIDIPLTHPDAGRMSPDTQAYVTFINTLLDVAETLNALTPASQLPIGFTRTVRAGKIYATATLEGTRYFAIAKVSYTPV